jgi:hypothetical protein
MPPKRNSTPPGSDGLAEAPPHFHGHRERLRSRFMEAGSEALADYEMLELVLFRAVPRRDVKPLAKDLLARFGSFAEVISAPPARLAEVDGLSEAAITEFTVVQAAAQRLAKGQVQKRPVLSSWSSVLDYIRAAQAFAGEGAIPHPVSRQAQSAHRRRDPAAGYGRSHASLSARGGQACAGTVLDRHHPGAQSSLG